MRDRISLSVGFEVKVIQFTLGKISTNNKIEGIQIYNRGTLLEFSAPTLKAQRFQMRTRIKQWGVNLITINRKTNEFEECESVIQTNTSFSQNYNEASEEAIPQFDLKVSKNDARLA